MLAIAGAKGGCGTTTVTVGLADAFTRREMPTVAVDTDRQLPNLHVVADVEREPTIADLEDGTDVEEVVQRRSSEAGVLPAATSTRQVDTEAALARLGQQAEQILLDCPSGAGPDAIEAIEYADRVVVVTTNTDRGLRGAETTIDVARRLGVPIVGTVVNESDGVTDALESKLGVSVLGTVPERESPLSSGATRAAFDDIAARITNDEPAYRRAVEYDDDRLAVGNDAIDSALEGGLPPGTVVALTADSASQSEQLLYEATATRGTLYLTTDRTVADVKTAIESATVRTGNPTVRRLAGEDPLEYAIELVEELPEGANLVVDSTNALERTDRSGYREFLNVIGDRMRESRGIALLHCLGDDRPEHRTMTRHLADAVFDLRTIMTGTETGVTHRLSIPKFRRDGHVSPTIELAREPRSVVSDGVETEWVEQELGDQ